MNKFYKVILVLFIFCAGNIAESAHAQYGMDKEFQPFLTRGNTTWEVKAGARLNNFDWNIASDITGTATPNIISELTWEDIILVEFGGEIRHLEPLDIGRIDGGLHLEVGANLGIPVTGDNQDSDYLGDNRTIEFSRSNNSGNTGYAVGLSGAVGYKVMLTGDPKKRAQMIANSRRPFTDRGRARKARAYRGAIDRTRWTASLTPLAGYGWSQQNYKMTSGEQTLDLLGGGGFLGPIDGLDSQYTADWYGPFLGIEGEIAGKKNMIRLRGEYHHLSYHADAIWNLRTDFRQDPSFTHEADGKGYKFEAEYAYAIDESYALTVDAMYQKRIADPGTSTFYLTTGAPSGVQRLNEVNDQSYGLNLGLRYNW